MHHKIINLVNLSVDNLLEDSGGDTDAVVRALYSLTDGPLTDDESTALTLLHAELRNDQRLWDAAEPLVAHVESTQVLDAIDAVVLRCCEAIAAHTR